MLSGIGRTYGRSRWKEKNKLAGARNMSIIDSVGSLRMAHPLRTILERIYNDELNLKAIVMR